MSYQRSHLLIYNLCPEGGKTFALTVSSQASRLAVERAFHFEFWISNAILYCFVFIFNLYRYSFFFSLICDPKRFCVLTFRYFIGAFLICAGWLDIVLDFTMLQIGKCFVPLKYFLDKDRTVFRKKERFISDLIVSFYICPYFSIKFSICSYFTDSYNTAGIIILNVN